MSIIVEPPLLNYNTRFNYWLYTRLFHQIKGQPKMIRSVFQEVSTAASALHLSTVPHLPAQACSHESRHPYNILFRWQYRSVLAQDLFNSVFQAHQFLHGHTQRRFSFTYRTAFSAASKHMAHRLLKHNRSYTKGQEKAALLH